MVTPAGLPAWTRSASPDIYGGIAGKRNLGDFGVVNAKTDVGAEAFVRITGDLAAAVQTAPLFWARILVAYSGGTATATVQECSTQWSGPSGSYTGTTPPTGNWPTVTTGTVTTTLDVEFSSLVSGTSLVVADDYGVDGTFNLEHATCGAHDVTFDTDHVSLNIAGCTTDGETLFLVVY